MVFPYDFGFIPDTKGEDGDPLDILVMCEFNSFPGCIMECRIIGGIKAEQTENKKIIRNDRFIGIPVESKTFKEIKTIKDIPEKILKELIQFFINYNKAEGKLFKSSGFISPKEALKMIETNE